MDKINQEIYERLKPVIDSQKFMSHLGIRITELSAGKCEMVMDYDERWSQQNGFFHGGVIGTLADNAAGLAAASKITDGKNCLTVEYKLNLLAPAKGDQLIGRCHLVKSGKTLTVAESNIYSSEGGKETHVATALLTLISV